MNWIVMPDFNSFMDFLDSSNDKKNKKKNKKGKEKDKKFCLHRWYHGRCMCHGKYIH